MRFDLFNKVKGINALKKFDIVLFAIVGALTVLGFFVLKSATATLNTGASILRTQMLSIGLGVVICIILAFTDYSYFKFLGYAFYAGTLLLLIYVIPFGYGRDVVGIGANSWIEVGSFMFQPSELAKISYMMVIPALLEKLKEEFEIKNFAIVTVLALLPIALILMQTDLGTATVFLVGLISILFVYGIRFRYFLITGVIAAATIPLVWIFGLDEVRKNRIRTFLNPLEDLDGAGYQVEKARIAIGSGQLKGSGLYQGVQSQQTGAIPVKESDFIFSVLAEELGFIGSVILILLATAFLVWCIRVAIKAKDVYGSLMVAGLTGMLAFHFVENIGMNIGILPVTGIPLPFVSAGGSAMVVNFIAVGIIMSVSAKSKT